MSLTSEIVWIFEKQLTVAVTVFQHSKTSSPACLSSQYFWKGHLPEQEWQILCMVWGGNKTSNVVTGEENPGPQNPWRDGRKEDRPLWHHRGLHAFPPPHFRVLSGERGLRYIFTWNTKSQGVSSNRLTWDGIALQKQIKHSIWIKSSSIKEKKIKRKCSSHLLLNKVGLKVPKSMKNSLRVRELKRLTQELAVCRDEGRLTRVVGLQQRTQAFVLWIDRTVSSWY